MRHNFELIPREEEGGRNRERTLQQVLTVKTKRQRTRLAIKMPIRALMNANAAPF